MALKNPLAYYTPGIPGRGAGTILKQPDLTGYAARQMKLTDLKLKQKQEEDALKAKKLSDIITVDGDIWLNDQKYFDDRINEFQKEAISVWSKSNGNPDAVSLAKLKQKQSAIESEMKESKFHEQQRKEAIAKIEAFAATGKYDDQDVNDAFTKWEEWSKLTPSERAKQSPANTLNQPFDYNKFKGDVQKGGMLAKTQVGTMGGMININGRDVQVTQKYDIYPTKAAAEDLWLAYANGRTKEKTGIEQRYETWKQYNPNQTATYTEYVVNPSMKNIDVIQHKDVPVTNLKEWIEKVEAPSIAKYGQQQGFVSSGGGGGNVSVNVSGSGVPQKTNIAASAPVSMPYGNVTVYGQKVDANKVIDEKSQLTFTPSKEAYTVEGDTPSAGIVQGGSAMIYPIAAKDIKWSTGAVSKKGTILARPEYWSEVDYNSWMDKNKNLYSYSPYILLYNTSAKNTTVDKFSKQESFIKANLGDDYWTEVWRITNEMNGGSTPAPQQQNNNTGGAPRPPKPKK